MRMAWTHTNPYLGEPANTGRSVVAERQPWRTSMSALSRRSALARGLVAVAGTVVKAAASQTMDMTAGKDTTLARATCLWREPSYHPGLQERLDA
jgi:hypothetical protein